MQSRVFELLGFDGSRNGYPDVEISVLEDSSSTRSVFLLSKLIWVKMTWDFDFIIEIGFYFLFFVYYLKN